MPSSTSSFDSNTRRAPRASQLLLLTLLIVALVAILREPTPAQTPSKWYWIDKLDQTHSAALVLAGDSRAYHGFDPRLFDSAHLGPTLNFSFHGVGFDADYLQAIERAASTEPGPPIILLGLTTRSLTEQALVKNRFKQTLSERRDMAWIEKLERKLEFISSRLSPLGLLSFPEGRNDALSTREGQGTRAQETETDTQGTTNFAQALSAAKANHANGKTIAPRLLADVTNHTSRWHSQGWRIYAVHVPAEPIADALSKEISGWNELQVELKLETSGAIWLRPPYDGLIAPDGIHLDSNSKDTLSRWLADAITEDIQNKTQAEVRP
jgi:hypothetical protein